MSHSGGWIDVDEQGQRLLADDDGSYVGISSGLSHRGFDCSGRRDLGDTSDRGGRRTTCSSGDALNAFLLSGSRVPIVRGQSASVLDPPFNTQQSFALRRRLEHSVADDDA